MEAAEVGAVEEAVGADEDSEVETGWTSGRLAGEKFISKRRLLLSRARQLDSAHC